MNVSNKNYFYNKNVLQKILLYNTLDNHITIQIYWKLYIFYFYCENKLDNDFRKKIH